MKIDGLSDKQSMIVNQVFNVVGSAGVAVYYYDGWDAVMYFFVGFAIMNAMDAAIECFREKHRKEKE